MKIASYFTFLILLVAGFGCKQQVADAYTQRLDSAILVVQTAQQLANQIDHQKIKKIGAVYAEYERFYSKEYDDLSDTSFYTGALNDMAICNKYVGRTVNNITGWQDELATTLKQLNNLKHDYENGLISASELQTHLNNELFATYQINKEIEKNVGQALDCTDNFKALTDVLDSVRVQWLAAQVEND